MKFQIFQAFLMLVAGLFPSDTQTMIRNKSIVVKDASVFVRSKITAGNTAKLIDGNTRRITGVTNIDGNKLDSFRNLIITHISVKYGTDTTITDPALIDYNSSDAPKDLRNAELVIRQNGRLIVSLPVSTFLPGKNASYAKIGSDRYELNIPGVIVEDQKFTVDIEFADGSDFGTNNHFAEVTLFGAETSNKTY